MHEKTSVRAENAKTTSKSSTTAPRQATHKRESSSCGSCGVCHSLRSPRLTPEYISTAMSQAKALGKESCAVSFMQQNYGNRFTSGVLAPGIQKKCSCGGSCSRCKGEEEADSMAMSIMKMESKPSAIRYQSSADYNEQTQISEIMANKGSGQRLDDHTRPFMEQRFGYDFSGVRIHHDSYAARKSNELNAEAFTIGRDVFFNAGRYNPSATSGKKLLAHELTHVVQQGSLLNGVNKKALQKMRRASAADPLPGCGAHGDFVVPPLAEHDRVDRAIAIITGVVDNPGDYPKCSTHFRDNCPGGTNASLRDQYNRAIVWKHNHPSWLGASCVGSPNIAYANGSYRWSHWAIAASLVHEMMHACGIGGHPPSALPGYTDILDEAKHWCGRLPNL